MYNEVTTQTSYLGDLIMSYKHFSTFERSRIEILHKLGKTTREIGIELGRHHSSIARELKRNSNNCYKAEDAHNAYLTRRLHSRPTGKITLELKEKIETALMCTWSPEQIAATIVKGVVCYKTIYRWLYQGLISHGNLSVLRHKGKRQKPRETRGRFNIGKPISQRPSEVKKRTTFGHWELDTVVSSRGKSKGCFATFVERKSRFYIAYKITDRCAASMELSIRKLANMLPTKAFQTATVDRGKEFSCFKTIEADLGIPVYFADAYSSWQRGSNENSNGLLREFFPKKTDLANVSEENLYRALLLINSRPRKCLGWKSSIEVFRDELSHLT